MYLLVSFFFLVEMISRVRWSDDWFSGKWCVEWLIHLFSVSGKWWWLSQILYPSFIPHKYTHCFVHYPLYISELWQYNCQLVSQIVLNSPYIRLSSIIG